MGNEKMRDHILKFVFRKIGHLPNKNASLGEIKILMGNIDNDEYWGACEELINEGFLLHRRNDYVALSPEGWDKAKALVDPPSNIYTSNINVGSAVNSPIQQGANSTMHQSTHYQGLNIEDLAKLIEIFENHIVDLKLTESDTKKAKAQIATIKAQLIDEPDPTIIRHAGKTLRNVTEGAIASLLASATQPTIWDIAHRILLCFQ